MQPTGNISSFKNSSLRIRINICRETGHGAVEVQDAVRWSSCSQPWPPRTKYRKLRPSKCGYCCQSFSCVWLCDPMDCSMPGFPVLHHLLEFAQTHVKWVVIPFNHLVLSFSCLQSFPASGSFPMRRFFASGDQNIGASASASILPMNIQGWFPLGLSGLILLSKGFSRVFSSTTVWRHHFSAQPFLLSSSHVPMWLLEKP